MLIQGWDARVGVGGKCRGCGLNVEPGMYTCVTQRPKGIGEDV